jgi:DNA-binding CsgD family transcriptional regulator
LPNERPVGERDANIDGLTRLLRKGKFGQARRFLEARSDIVARLERARLALFLDDDLACTEKLATSVAFDDTATSGQRLLARAICACARASDRRELGRVCDLADLSDVDKQILAECVYYVSLAHYIAGDVGTAQVWLDGHAPQEPEWRARYDLLRGQFSAAREQFIEQARFANRALDLLEREAPDHAYLIANAARTLAVIVRDVPAPGVERLQRLYQTLGDDEGFTGARFHTLRALGWAHAVRGDCQAAMSLVLRALAEALSDLERIYACADHALVAIFAEERYSSSAVAASSLARELARKVQWQELVSNDVAALPLVAQVAAETGALEEAQLFCDLAAECRPRIRPRFSLAHDRRFEAMTQEATALAYADRNRSVAFEAAVSAHATYTRMDHHWRAARMAILLLQITRATIWRDRALSHLESYPKSPFHRLLDRPRLLTKRQEDVLGHIRMGLSDFEIAEKLGISYKTVRIHLGRVLQAYGVKNRTALVAKS